MWVDSHVNLHGERYAEDLDDVLARADAANVGAMLLISDRLDNTEDISRIAATRKSFTRTVGVHPHHAKDFQDLSAQDLVGLAEYPDVVGIGECGLDYYYEYSPPEDQRRVFAEHIKASQITQLPLVIHTRDADDDMQRMLTDAHQEQSFPLLLHCFTSGQELMEAGLALGGYVAFSGILTFKKADEVRALSRAVPLDRLLIETDCPFLAPIPHRGRRNEPAFVPLVGVKLAEVRGESVEMIEAATTENFFTLFSKAPRP